MVACIEEVGVGPSYLANNVIPFSEKFCPALFLGNVGGLDDGGGESARNRECGDAFKCSHVIYGAMSDRCT
jgi:hypothetical protein